MVDSVLLVLAVMMLALQTLKQTSLKQDLDPNEMKGPSSPFKTHCDFVALAEASPKRVV